MINFLIDTNLVSEVSKPTPSRTVLQWLAATDPNAISVSVITIGELHLGAELLPLGARRTAIEAWIRRDFPLWFGNRLLPLTEPIAIRWAVVTAVAKQRGRVLTMADGLLAATALELNLTLVTRNTRDFEATDVQLFNPWEVSY